MSVPDLTAKFSMAIIVNRQRATATVDGAGLRASCRVECRVLQYF
jgi:hypothetical protein